MNSLFINETALHTRLLHPTPPPCSRLRGEGGLPLFASSPEAPGSSWRVFAWDTFVPANVREQSGRAGRGQLRMSLPRERRTNSYYDKLACAPNKFGAPEVGLLRPGQASLPPGERAPRLVFLSVPPRFLLPGDPEPRAPSPGPRGSAKPASPAH